MPSMLVRDAGFFVQVQDLGRFGYQQYGVPVGGALDSYSLRAGNRLVGNADGASALEVSVQGPGFEMIGEGIVAVTGGKLPVFKNGVRVPMWEALPLHSGDQLQLGALQHGSRAYICVAGGIDVPVVLGSRSTFLRGAFGGFQGRPIRVGDVLPLTDASVEQHKCAGNFVPRSFQIELPTDCIPVRVMFGPQDHLFSEAALSVFCTSEYQVATESDRMGCRLQGEAIKHDSLGQAISDGVALGSVQILGNGQPAILLADRQTTGGYLKIATVISADLSVLGQVSPKQKIRFVPVSYEVAIQALRSREAALDLAVHRAVRRRMFSIAIGNNFVQAEVCEL